jgi:hypothetical protein
LNTNPPTLEILLLQARYDDFWELPRSFFKRETPEKGVQQVGGKLAWEEGIMERLQAFQTAARQGGFVAVNESAEGTVLWLRKNTPDTARETHQRMCIDSLTNSVTVYWMSIPGKLNAKTFRGVPALQEWFELRPESIVER